MVAVVVVGSSCRAIPLPPPPATIRFAQLICLVLIICIHQLPLVCSYGSNNSRLNNVSINCCPEHERQALHDMQPDFGDGNPSGWGAGTNCCQWYGIGCDRRTGHVVRIDLRTQPNNGIGGWVNLNNSLLALQHLRYLDLSGTSISSLDLGFMGSFQNLRYLNLSCTFISNVRGGELSVVDRHQFGNLSRLRTLSLLNYDLNIQIDDPRWLSRLTSLQQIEFGPVNLGSGWVLQALSMLPSIRVIRVELSSVGSWVSPSAAPAGMPSSLNPLNFTNLSVLDLTGDPSDHYYKNVTIPSWLSSLTRLQYLRLRNLNLGGGLTALWNLSSSSSSLEVLDLSSNQLQGSIPDTWGSISMLRELHLSDNNLSGSIPQSLGRLSRLEILDFSYNRLTGPIPPSLANLSSLGNLDLSYNNLSGRIPTGGQFQDPYVYWGNPFLNSSNVIIGNTTTEAASIGENTDDDGVGEKFGLYISIYLGFVVGIWAVLGPLLFKKAWRYAYFRAMDTVRDKILCLQSQR